MSKFSKSFSMCSDVSTTDLEVEREREHVSESDEVENIHFGYTVLYVQDLRNVFMSIMCQRSIFMSKFRK